MGLLSEAIKIVQALHLLGADDLVHPYAGEVGFAVGRFRRRRVEIGLAVARGFVRAMEGELIIEDTPGGGTTAVVSL